ncbi:MAG: NAD-dependent epimerase/dehydratase family protein [Gammaproteobacteria bacterium]|nr:NAD-dependent epimerase/dehydratase family protein [Gammaproteobacteria bacterium]
MGATRSLILGGTAFIGRHLVEHLQAAGHEVAILNRGGSAAPDGVEQLVADRKDSAAMARALRGRQWDAVYDVSASAQVASVDDIATLIDELDGRCGVYLFVSSIAAYRMGHGSLPWTEELPTTRSRPGKYGGHKAAVEQLLAARRARNGFAYTVLRPAAVYGPHNNIPDGEMAMFLRLAQWRPVLLPHDGLVCFPYGHAEDLARAMHLAASTPAALGEVFNICADSVTSRYFVDTIAAIMGVEADIVLLPDDITATLEPPWPFNHRFQKSLHAVVSTDKARRVLGFESRYDFAAGHQHTYEWFMANGLERMSAPMNDPVWNISWDFAREAEVVKRVRESGV